MAKRSQSKQQYKQYECNTPYSPSRGESKGQRKRRQHFENSNIVDLKAHSQLDTAYLAQQKQLPLSPRNEAQRKYIQAIKTNNLTFGIGPAGTGKSYCAGMLAAELLEAGKVEQIIITRPAVEAGEQLGFLPGDLNDKFSVYIDVFRDILNERLGKGVVDYCLRHGRIIAAPLAYMRGKTFQSSTFVILDEAQNTTPAQMKMFLTRIGEDCKVVVNGDLRQSDLSLHNGLADALTRVNNLPGVYVHEFERADIVRSGLVRGLLDRYELPLAG